MNCNIFRVQFANNFHIFLHIRHGLPGKAGDEVHIDDGKSQFPAVFIHGVNSFDAMAPAQGIEEVLVQVWGLTLMRSTPALRSMASISASPYRDGPLRPSIRGLPGNSGPAASSSLPGPAGAGTSASRRRHRATSLPVISSRHKSARSSRSARTASRKAVSAASPSLPMRRDGKEHRQWLGQ